MASETRVQPLRVAVIGTGFGGRVLLPGFLGHAETNVVALCGTSEEKTQNVAQKYGVRAVYTNYQQMLADVEPDLVAIATPPKRHQEMVLAALQKGAHVLCEKPLAMNAAEAQVMLAEAEQHNRIHVVDHEFRYLPARYYQRVLFDQGYIGEPVLLEATLMSTMRWDPTRPWNWWMDEQMGGGLLGALGSHYIDAFRWLTGREVQAVTAVLHTTPQYLKRPLPDGGGERVVTTDDSAVLILEMADDLLGVIHISAVAAGEVRRLAVHGTEGALVVENDVRLVGRRRDEPPGLIEIPPEYDPPLWVPDENLLLGPFAKLLGLMVDEIRGRAVITPPTFVDGLTVQRVIDAAHISSREGRRVTIKEAGG